MNNENSAKEASKSRLRYMARYGGQKTLICLVKGERIVKIYKARGFVEVSEQEYQRILQSKRER